ncbi:uncharacterized protein LOC122019928 [Zingiber officinale]|uniref:uncharacterized protein LOC122019928 n=1 Tax=Zingiber officinale TaxID=94328 RepID=UPI001C4D0168|nr:uncharacterized protein LOC122019928 [Zingiber officinale]
MASLLVSLPLPSRLRSSLALSSCFPIPHLVFARSFPWRNDPSRRGALACFALAESDFAKSEGGDSSGDGQGGSDDEDLLPLLRDLADSFVLPPDYLSKLPRDLRLDLNDAAFDLSNGPILDECGEELGNLLLNISRAWEQADTSTSNRLARQLPSMDRLLTEEAKASFGKRLVAAGRRFQAMGQYGDGELQKIAIVMIKTGKQLSRFSVIKTAEKSKSETRAFKFGELQVALTSEKAYIGAGIGLIFGVISWQLSQGIQSIPESSLEYANDNALLLAKSLRGALLVIFYSSTILSAFASVGLVFLGRQLSSENK